MNMLKSLAISSTALILAGCSQTNIPAATITPPPAATTETVTTTPATGSRVAMYTMSDISQHNSESDCWLVIDSSVYDVTSFITDHPGGEEILNGCGKDATDLFKGQAKHGGPEAQTTLPTLKIGELTE